MGKERRGQPRYDIIAQIRVKRGHVNYLMDVRNISYSGAFISSDRLKDLPWFREGAELEMHLFTTEDLHNVRVSATIVRIVGDGKGPRPGFGVQFEKLNEQQLQDLYHMVAFASTQSIHPPPLPGGG